MHLALQVQIGARIAGIVLGLEALGFQALEPEAETFSLPVEDLVLATGAIEEHEQQRQAVDGFAEVDGLWIQADLLHLGVGTHHGGAPLGKTGRPASRNG